MPGLTLDIAANTRDFQKGVQDAADELDKVSDALDDAARDGDKATERLETSFRDLARTAQRETKKAGDDLDQNITRGATNAKQAMGEVKSEALANAAETFSSFDGTATSFVSGIQGTFGGLIASLGAISPALLPVGVAGAAAVGLISSAIGLSEERAEAFRQKVSELTTEYIEATGTGTRSADTYVTGLRNMAIETDRGKANLVDMKLAAEDLGISVEDVAKAYVGGGQPLDDLIRKTEELLDAEDNRRTARAGGRRASEDLQADEISNLEDELRLYKEQRDAIVAAQEAELTYLQSGVSDFEAKVGLIDAVNTSYDEAAGATDDFIVAETGVFDTAAYIAAMQERETALKNYQTALATADLSTEAKAFLNEQGAEAAAQMLAGYTSAEPATKAELNRIWTEAGRDNSGTYANELGTGLSRESVDAPPVNFDAKADARAYADALQTYLNRNPVTVPVRPSTPYGRDLP